MGLPERSYRSSPVLRGALGLLFAAFAAGAVAVGLLDLVPDRGLSVVLLMGSGLAWWGWSMARRRRVIIDGGGIALVEWRRPRRLELRDLLGYRRGYYNNAVNLFFVARQPGVRPLAIPWMASMDAGFEAWLRQVPELDAPQGAEAEARRAFDRDRPVARRFNRVALAAAAVALVAVSNPPGAPGGPWTWAAAAALLMPPVCILFVALGRGRFTLAERGGRDPRPSVVLAFILPGFAGFLRPFSEYQVLAYGPVAIAALGGAALLGLAAWRADRTLRGRRALVLLLFLPLQAMPAAGALLVVNCAADTAPGVAQEPAVLAKRHIRGKGGGYFLDLELPGPSGRESLRVSWPVFDGARVGQPVPVRLKPGLLGFPWVQVG